jgi:hypothetical protein
MLTLDLSYDFNPEYHECCYLAKGPKASAIDPTEPADDRPDLTAQATLRELLHRMETGR